MYRCWQGGHEGVARRLRRVCNPGGTDQKSNAEQHTGRGLRDGRHERARPRRANAAATPAAQKEIDQSLTPLTVPNRTPP
jgi:hypothetical protein